MIGQPRPFIRFDDHILFRLGRLHQKIQSGHGNVQCTRRCFRRIAQRRMQLIGNVMDRAAGMQIGGLAHRDHAAVVRHRLVIETLCCKATFGFRINRNPALATRRCGAPRALTLDQTDNR